MTHATVLIVDDEELIRWSLRERFESEGYAVVEAGTSAEALARVATGVDVVLLDYRLPDGDGVTALHRVNELAPDTPVIFITAADNVDEARKGGAYHCLNKPFDLDDVVATAEKALEAGRLRREVRALRTNAGRDYRFDAIVGNSRAMHRVKSLLMRAAASPASTALLTGEAGTGKTLAARVVHYNSARAPRPFVDVSCAAPPQSLDESIRTASGGTIFLDEIGALTPDSQAWLLRLLSDRDVPVDVHVMAATSRDLDEAIAAGTFREDLFSRLQGTRISLPPLRERDGDIPVLANYYIERYNRELRKRVKGVAPGVTTVLEEYRWPGNVRELRNLIERAMLLVDREWLRADDFAALTSGATMTPFRLPPGGIPLEDVEKDLVAQALERCGGNQTHAGRLLGINRDQVRYRIEKFGLHRRDRHQNGGAVGDRSPHAVV